MILGEVLALSLGSYILSWFGWKIALYFPAILMTLTTILIAYNVYSSPRDHPRMRAEEVEHIQANTKGGQLSTAKKNTPYLKMLSCTRAWSYAIAESADALNYTVFYLLGPAYLTHIHSMDFKTQGWSLAAMSVVAAIASVPLGRCVDKVIEKEIVSATKARKLVNGTATFLAIVAWFMIAFLGDNSVAVTLVSLAIIILTCNITFSGYQVRSLTKIANFCIHI